MKFIETRGNDKNYKSEVEFSHAILNPSASFGGLYVPKFLPTLDSNFFNEFKDKSYKELTMHIITKFNIDIEKEVLEDAFSLYDNFDDSSNPAPTKKLKDDLFVNELYHGPTRAFKDMALQPFGYILSHLAKKIDKKYLILAATSGDTGPATLETFKNKPNIQVVCLYPDGGTSDVQRLQMVTEDGENLKVIGIKGNFDDAQHALKTLLASESFKDALNEKNISLSAANSVNFGRIIMQIIYHIKGYLDLLSQNEIQNGEEVYFSVPSGNFGNALGAYYAKKMGLPVKKILIASNINNILTDLITKGEYDIRDRELILTTSPAMDILKSSNVERVLFDKFGNLRTKQMMDSLNSDGVYTLSTDELALLREDFEATFSDDEYAKSTIKKFAKSGYIMDPHTATCIKAYEELKDSDAKMIICSTAEWTKFAPTMLNALNENSKKYSDLKALTDVSKELDIEITPSIMTLFDKKIIHDSIIEKDQIENEILKFLN